MSSLALCGRWLEPAILLFYASLLYKLAALGILASAVMGLALIPLRDQRWRTNWYGPALAIAYTAMATITAFQVDVGDGLKRTVQFALIVSAVAASAKYLAAIDDERRRRFIRLFAYLNAAVVIHLIAYHLSHGHVVTWKYLYDTKFSLSIVVIALFFYEDDIRLRARTLWYLLLVGLTIAILMSGERKAYMLLAAVYLLSRESLRGKVLTCVSALIALAIFAFLEPDSYVVHQLSSSGDYGAVSNRYFLSQIDLGRHSDAIREFVNRNAFHLFKQHPLFGAGATGYVAWAQKTYGSMSASHGLSMNVHGEIYRVLAEGGLVGAAIALSYLAVLALAFFGYARRSDGRDQHGHPIARYRGVIYLFMMMIFYLSSEALDTMMLLLILTGGFLAGAIGHSDVSVDIRGSRSPARRNAAA